MKAIVIFRNGGIYDTEINEANTPKSLGLRMCGGGFVVCEDSNFGQKREIIINLADVSTIIRYPKQDEPIET